MIGTTLQHYRILRVLGRGGMAEVYEAEDLRLHHVTLKFASPVPAPGLYDPCHTVQIAFVTR